MAELLPRFEDLIEAHQDEIYAYVWRLLDGASRADAAVEAHDTTQDTFLRAYRAYSKLPGGSNARAWLYKIATNSVMSLLRRKGRARSLDEEIDDLPAPPDGLPEAQAMFSQTLAETQAAMSELPPKQRVALAMRYVQELGYDEIALALGCSEDSARAHVYQALKRLRTTLGDSHENE